MPASCGHFYRPLTNRVLHFLIIVSLIIDEKTISPSPSILGELGYTQLHNSRQKVSLCVYVGPYFSFHCYVR